MHMVTVPQPPHVQRRACRAARQPVRGLVGEPPETLMPRKDVARMETPLHHVRVLISVLLTLTVSPWLLGRHGRVNIGAWRASNSAGSTRTARARGWRAGQGDRRGLRARSPGGGRRRPARRAAATVGAVDAEVRGAPGRGARHAVLRARRDRAPAARPRRASAVRAHQHRARARHVHPARRVRGGSSRCRARPAGTGRRARSCAATTSRGRPRRVRSRPVGSQGCARTIRVRRSSWAPSAPPCRYIR